MPSDYTIFQFDVGERSVRWILSSIPGVTPLPSDERTAVDGEDEQIAVDKDDESEEAHPVDSHTEDSHIENTEAPTESAGSSSERGTQSTRPGTPSISWPGAPSTPWPGAPTGDDDEDGGFRSRLGRTKVLVAIGFVLGLGVIGATAVWLLKFSGEKGDSDARSTGPDAATSMPRTDGERGERVSSGDDIDARSYPVDVSPIVGIGFLAVAALAIRQIRSSNES